MSEIFDYFKLPPNLSYTRFLLSNNDSYHYGIIDNGTGFKGFGGDRDETKAQTKAVFELIERTVFKKKDEGHTSSGWAAHESLILAKESACLELIERDAILCSWLLRISPKIIFTEVFSVFEKEFPILQFGKGNTFFIYGVILEYKNKKMLISTSATSYNEGLKKLRIDSERAFELLLDESAIDDKRLLEHHNHFCNLTKKDLEWFYLNGKGLEYKILNFQFDVFEVPLWNGETAWVVKALSKQLQNLFFGPTSDEYLNSLRLSELNKRFTSILNRSFHPIL